MTLKPNDYRTWLFGQLATLYRAGLTWAQIGPVLAQQQRPSAQLRDFTQALTHGYPLAEAGRRSRLLLAWEIRLLQAAESSGKLDSLLSYFTEHYRERAQQSRQLRNRMAYPVLILILSVFIAPVPALVSGTLEPSAYLARTVLPLLGLFFIVQQIKRAWQRMLTDNSRAVSDALLLRLPIVQLRLRRDVLLSLTLAIDAGIPALEALELAANSTTSAALRRALREVIRAVEQGVPLSQALADAGLLTDQQLTELLATGEYAGRLDDMLAHGLASVNERLHNQVNALAEWLPRFMYAGVVAWLVSGWLR